MEVAIKGVYDDMTPSITTPSRKALFRLVGMFVGVMQKICPQRRPWAYFKSSGFVYFILKDFRH
jgi:hypothetical protein